ncbi:hypothetical protein Bca4012_021377 [Brassica carinata]|uniref:Uncharacterized protein n=1 Tax=Brassica carinata TaxID=52824 RepID=A0A8X8BBX7_BRACI|nr:hypothetical protein Bca52824_000182 [Brassica carinata]
MEIHTLLNNVSRLSNSVGNGNSYTEKGLESKVTPCVDPVVQVVVGEAKERLKKLEQDYQRTYKKYREAQLIWCRCYLDEKGFEHHSRRAGYCIKDSKNLVKELQNILGSLNIEEASRRTETPNHFRQILADVPRISSKKHVHYLLSEFKETNRLREAATERGAMILAKLIKELEKEKEKNDNILRDKRRVQQGYTEKIKHLQDKKEWICGKWDDERKYMLRLKKVDDGVEYFRPDSERWRHEPFILPYFFLQ